MSVESVTQTVVKSALEPTAEEGRRSRVFGRLRPNLTKPKEELKTNYYHKWFVFSFLRTSTLVITSDTNLWAIKALEDL